MSDPATSAYRDDDLVYVDPDSKEIIGLVEWSRAGNPKTKFIPREAQSPEEGRGGKGRRRSRERKHYPWGTLRAMRRVYSLEGKQRKSEPQRSLDDVLPKAIAQAYWE